MKSSYSGNKHILENINLMSAATNPSKKRALNQKQEQCFETQTDSNIAVIAQSPASPDDNSSKVIAITYKSIPEYLRNSELYKSFQEGLHDGEDGNQDILIPAKFYKLDESINSQEDLCLKILIAKKRWRKLIPSSTIVQQQPLAWLLFPNIYGTANCRRISETPQLLKV